MISRITIALMICLFMIACNNSERSRPADALGVGREFINASLKGEYREAKKYLLADSLNISYFEQMESFYLRMPEQEKQGYKSANIIINPIENISDSIAIINYSNTFKKEPAKIKLVRIEAQWWVDFKYSFSGNL